MQEKSFSTKFIDFLILTASSIMLISQLKATFAGIEHYLNNWAFVIIVIIFSVLRYPHNLSFLSVVVMVGSFLGAMSVWGWPWYLALIYAQPFAFFLVTGYIWAKFFIWERENQEFQRHLEKIKEADDQWNEYIKNNPEEKNGK